LSLAPPPARTTWSILSWVALLWATRLCRNAMIKGCSPARVAWTPTGTNVPDYPKLAQLWWQNIGEAVSGEVTVDRAMDNLAEEMDKVMERIARAKVQKVAGPQLNTCGDPNVWLNKAGSPKAKVNEKPKGQTVDYDQLIQAWREGRVK